VRLLTVGRLHPIKGYPVLLEACGRLREAGIDWSLEMVGDGPMLGSLRKLASDLGVADRVSFSGAVGQDQIRSHYEAADVLVVSSFMEGVPVVLIEAMATGVIGLATAVGGVPELIRSGQNGLTVPPASVDALAEAMVHLATAGPALTPMAQAARRTIEAGFSIATSADQMADLFARYGVSSGGAT
jgi:glycosyltransferase involved in cell wall biosynthesis